jgi:zinc transport system substrate-binding protein
MMDLGRVCWLVVLVAVCFLAAPASADDVKVVVTVPPLAGLVEAIGGEHVDVESLLTPTDNPHTYDPTPRQVAAASEADLFVGAGAQFEVQLMARLVAARPGFPAISVAAAGATGEEGDHEDMDPHVWLSGPTVKKAARIIGAALAQINPENGASYQANLDRFLEQAGEVDHRVGMQLAPYADQPFLVYHPAFGYFAEAYGLRQLAVEQEGHDPAPRQLQETIEEAQAAGVKVIFVQPQFDPHAAEAVRAAIEGEVVILDPLKRDVLGNLKDIADALEKSFKK